jgi:dihydrofolate reductase
MILSCIAAVAENRVIGHHNDLPWRLPEDLKRFKKLTMGHSIIMGRKTFESIGNPLPNRTSIVITRDTGFSAFGAIVVSSFPDAVRRADDIAQDADGSLESFVIGGATVFREALSRCERLYLTHVHAAVKGNILFPEMNMNEWHILHKKSHPADKKNDYPTTFAVYERVKSPLK